MIKRGIVTNILEQGTNILEQMQSSTSLTTPGEREGKCNMIIYLVLYIIYPCHEISQVLYIIF